MAASSTHNARPLSIRMIERINIITLAGCLRQRRSAFDKEFIERLRTVRVTREPEAHANNGHIFITVFVHCTEGGQEQEKGRLGEKAWDKISDLFQLLSAYYGCLLVS